MKPIKSKKKSDVQNMSLDNFFDNMDADLDAENIEENGAQDNPGPPLKKKFKTQGKSVRANTTTDIASSKKSKKKRKTDHEDTQPDVVNQNNGQKDVVKEHQQALEKLKDTDPELYAFLKQNDKKLLKFGSMTLNDEDSDSNDDHEEGSLHELPEKLEVASDDSDFDGDEKDEEQSELGAEPGGQTKITLKLLKKWTDDLTARPMKNVHIIRTVCKAFNSVLVTVTGETNVLPAYKAEGSAIFNGVVQLCVLHLGNAVKEFLNVTSFKGHKNLKKNKKFAKIQACLRMYFVDLTNLLENVSSSHIMNVLLKHLHQFSSLLVCYPSITKPILKRLIIIWSTSEEESVRVLAFLCILKITCSQLRRFLSDVLKNMYLAYVKNSKFVSPNTLPVINFMRRSLTEMFTLDMAVSYQHVFLYIRQLAIHLRNAVILQKKDSFQYIYNWQYVNSLKLWSDVLAATYDKKELEPLIYPFVSIVTGVIKLIPSAQYFPLRFHCCRMLIELSGRTRVFIPVLPYLTEVLSSNSFNEEHKKLSMKPVNLICLLRFAPANIQENAYKDAVLDQVYELAIEYLAHEAASLSFPDLVVPIVTALRTFCKTTKVYKYSRKIKQLSDKVVENAVFIEKERETISFPLKDLAAVQSWEAKRKVDGTPFWRFYESFAKENEKLKRRQACQSDDVNDYDLPVVKKAQNPAKPKTDGPVDLFPSDDEDSGNEMLTDMPEASDEPKPTQRKNKKGKLEVKAKSSKKQHLRIDYELPVENFEDDKEVDILKDITLDDWE